MLSYDYIQAEARKAARTSRGNGVQPASIESFNAETPLVFVRDIPFLGDRTPRGYKKIEELFVDSSGWGTDGEPALSVPQFIATLVKYQNERKPYAFSISEAGQFQVYIRVFLRKDGPGL